LREGVAITWKECNIVEESLRFVARLPEGEKMFGLLAHPELTIR
jgi:hypothetical protein